MFTILNDGRKVNMTWVLSYCQEQDTVVYDMVKGKELKIIEQFNSSDDAKARVEELNKDYLIK